MTCSDEYNRFLPQNYDPPHDPTLNWRHPDSSERQRQEWERFRRETVVLAFTWPWLMIGGWL